MIYSEKVSQSIIDLEDQNFIAKPLVFEKQVGFPYHDLQPRDFERLLYCLFRKKILNSSTKDFNDIQLMQGVGERGRDSLLLKEGESVGLIQCKRYKNNIDVSEVGKEIIKFIIYYTQDNSLISNVNNFTYIFAVSYGFSEKALNFINSLSSNTYNKEQVEVWAKEIITKTTSLNTVRFEVIKDILFQTLNKFNFKKIIPDDLNLMIEDYPEVKTMFFELKPIIDIKSFEKLLSDREKIEVKIINTSSNLERVLEAKNKYLYNKLQETKKIVQDLINEFSANFTLYTHHNKTHTLNLTEVLGKKVLDQSILKELNEKELYVLAAASYLHDIGICISNSEIEKIYREYLENTTDFKRLNVYEYIRDQHSYLTFDYISENWELLKLENELKEAIALIAGESLEINVFEYKNFEYAPDGGREKVCLPYLYTLLRIADMSDIENINANYLLRTYEDMEEYAISKKLWEETEISIKTIIKNEDRLVFIGNCEDQLLFISINRHIEELKRLYEQLISEVRKYKYNARFTIYFIEESIDTGFSKRLGFTIDYKGIAETLIGENIYNNKYDAVREVIQNSIDSCSLKIKKDVNYKPLIKVILTKNSLIIKDNGLGMDEYIIKKYFSKLCKSYYKDFGLDAIGQFGIGVFSYFMLCDNFTVETRVKAGKLIKFNAYKNLYSYFYFFEEDTSQLEEGTMISLHLTENILKDLNLNKLTKAIRDYFKFVNIPIEIINRDNCELIEKEPFTLSVEEVLINKIEYKNRHKMNDLMFLESYIENEDYEGICGLIFEKSENTKFMPFNFRSISDGLSFMSEGTSLICQKGVKVINDSSRYMFNLKIFQDLIYKINIKKNLSLNLGRNNFQGEKLFKITYQFEVDLLSKFFNSIHDQLSKDAYLYNAQFVKNYIKTYRFPYNELDEFVLNNFYIEVFNKNTMDHFILSNFLSENEQFVLIGGQNWEIGKLELLYSKIKMPIVYIENDDLVSFYYNYFVKLDYLLTIDEHDLLLISKTKARQQKNKVGYEISIPFSNNLLFKTIESIGIGKTFYNSNHPLIQFYIENVKKIKGDRTFYSQWNQFFKHIESIYSYKKDEISLQQTNIFLEEILKPFNRKIRITYNDFPVKYREKILW
ncbi:HD domain-containing protein [Bacillus safensis]|uniref:HD domain-containing protein n=1 Tax=Bacillus safensis TaxID=561879 RepID=UPI003981F195